MKKLATNLQVEEDEGEQNPQSSRSKVKEETKNILVEPVIDGRDDSGGEQEENPLANPE